MSEDDRAAKAARAKALLKKRREKAAGVPLNSGVGSPVSPSRTFSPAPSEVTEDDKRDLGDVFAKDVSDTSWLTSLPRAASPPVPPTRVESPQVLPKSSPSIVAPSPRSSVTFPTPADKGLQSQVNSLRTENISLAAEVKRLQAWESKMQQTEALLEEQRVRSQVLEGQLQQLEVEKDTLLRNEQQTISLLVSEKSSLMEELERLEGVESRAQNVEILLGEERQRSNSLDQHAHQLQVEVQEANKLTQGFQIKERELTERCREQERQLQLTTATLSDLKQETEQYQRRIRELEEQIQSDDRVERLEESLKNTQDRADELEFQLSKLTQVHTALKVERDEIDSQRRAHSQNESELEAKHLELQSLHTGILQQLATAVSENDTLSQEKLEMLSQATSVQQKLLEAQEERTKYMAELSASSRQLQALQVELRNATRRAEDAEKTQKDLQAEGTSLMRSLDEMRPKIIELTGVKLELMEKLDSLGHVVRARETTIAELESTLEEVRDQHEKGDKQLKEIITQHEKEKSLALSESSELHKAYAKLQEELDTTTASLHNLEIERSINHQEASRRLEEIERLNTSSLTQAGELSTLRRELDARRNAEDEEQDFLQRAQNEIESLRADLAARDDEISRLQEASPSQIHGPHSLDDEMLSSLQQQHALELSAAHSQIRTLENSVYDADARSHTLLKQVASLEQRLAQFQSRPSSRLGQQPQQRSFSPLGVGPRPSSRARSSSDLRRASFGGGQYTPQQQGQVPMPLSRAVFEQGMSAETRHKRLISLSMLKARIDSEVATAAAAGGGSRPSSRASSVRGLSPVRSEETNSRPHSRASNSHSHSHSFMHVGHKPQFLDDSHVFWCHSCSGDLIIL